MWVVGSDQLKASSYKQAHLVSCQGIQTMVLIPVCNGAVELGSTDLIAFCSSLLFC